MITRHRASAQKKSRRAAVAWAAGATLAAFAGAAASTHLQASAAVRSSSVVESALEQALGAPTGVLAVLNPVNCSLTARDAAALNSLAKVPGLRVTVLLLAISPRDSLLQRVRSDFSFAPEVSLQSASQFDPSVLPPVFRQPFVAVLKRGQLHHAAWGEALKALGTWLPELIVPRTHSTAAMEP